MNGVIANIRALFDNMLLQKLRRHRETLATGSIGTLVFSLLNAMMVCYHYAIWTNPKGGFWTAFTRFFHISGFDPYTYIIISKWRQLYEIDRHPLLALFVWPLSALNEWLMTVFHINCAVLIVGVLWTVFSTLSWCLLYKIIRKIIGLEWWNSLLLCFFFFSIAYVMLATIVPDHMLLSMTLLLFTLWTTCKIEGKKGSFHLLKIMLVYFVSTGVTLTNSVKVWLADLVSYYQDNKGSRRLPLMIFKRCLLYVIPTVIIGCAYVWQVDSTVKEEKTFADGMTQKAIQKDSVFARKYQEDQAKAEQMRKNMVVDNKLFMWTDSSIDRWPLLYENILGEGFFLHKDHFLGDANGNRPVFVYYSHVWFYMLEAFLFVLVIVGIWLGRHTRLLQVTLSMLSVDFIIHFLLRFAASDVYIMTAHWAFIYPISIAFLLKWAKHRKRISIALSVCMLIITLVMWTYNLGLIYPYIIK